MRGPHLKVNIMRLCRAPRVISTDVTAVDEKTMAGSQKRELARGVIS